jgi:signal transduction histidine kinase
LNPALDEGFDGIEVLDSSNKIIIAIPNVSAVHDPGLFDSAIVVPIRSNESAQGPLLAQVVFHYSTRDLLGASLLAALAIFAIASLLYFRSRRRLLKQHEILLARENLLAVRNLAQQVAHDIQSPLAALSLAARDLPQLPQISRDLIENATARIRNIASDLLKQNTNRQSPQGERTQNDSEPLQKRASLTSIEDIASLSLPIVQEKRTRHRDRKGVRLETLVDVRDPSACCLIHAGELQRAVSNLLDNAFDAISGEGTVVIELKSDDSTLRLRVQDSGEGIPQEMISRLGQRGASFKKSGGTGLGLFHARQCIESWGGKLEIQSKVGEGTAVSLLIPVRARS